MRRATYSSWRDAHATPPGERRPTGRERRAALTARKAPNQGSHLRSCREQQRVRRRDTTPERPSPPRERDPSTDPDSERRRRRPLRCRARGARGTRRLPSADRRGPGVVDRGRGDVSGGHLVHVRGPAPGIERRALVPPGHFAACRSRVQQGCPRRVCCGRRASSPHAESGRSFPGGGRDGPHCRRAAAPRGARRTALAGAARRAARRAATRWFAPGGRSRAGRVRCSVRDGRGATDQRSRPPGSGARTVGSRHEITSRPAAVRRIVRAAHQRARSGPQVAGRSLGPGAGVGHRTLDLRLPVPVRCAPRSRRAAAAVRRARSLCGRTAARPAPADSRRDRGGRGRPTGTLALAGVAAAPAALATLAYRLASYWLSLPVGLVAWIWYRRRYVAPLGPIPQQTHSPRNGPGV